MAGRATGTRCNLGSGDFRKGEELMEPDITLGIGVRLREMRKMRGQSLREQARLIGMSPSTLSELERGIAGVSLQKLQSVVGNLGISLAELLSTKVEDRSVSRPLEILSPAEVARGSIERGKGVHYTLIGSNGDHKLQPYLITFDAGCGYADDPITHPGEEFVYVLFGEIVLHLGDKQYHLVQGTTARFNSDTPHAFSNASHNTVAGVIGAGTPPW
jgi:transcriptional regulator with XRE-family HTH domain